MLNYFLTKRSFESRLLFTLSVLAVARILVGVLQDHLGTVPWEGLLIDYCLLFIFIGIAYYTFQHKDFRFVHPLLGFVLLFLMAVLFIRSGGVEGTDEFNFYALIVVLALLYQGGWQKVLLAFSFITFAYLAYVIHVKNAVYDFLFVRNSRGYDNFLFTLLALSALTIYVKWLIETKERRFNAKNKELREKINLVSDKNTILNRQQILLAQTNLELQRKIDERKAYHEHRTKALNEYIEQNTKKIQHPIRNLQEVIEKVDKPYPERYKEMLASSVKEIFSVVKGINKSLHSEYGHINSNILSENHEDEY